MIPSVRPGGFGPQAWGVDPSQEWISTGVDQEQAAAWAERRAMQDALDAERAANEQGARQADTSSGIKALGTLGKSVVQNTSMGRSAQDWIASKTGRPVRTGYAGEKYGLNPKLKSPEMGESYNVGDPSGQQMIPQGPMPPNPPPTPSVSDVARAVKPAPPGAEAGASTGAASGMMEGAGNFIGHLLGGAAITAGGVSLAQGGRTVLPADRGDANRARAVGGATAAAGALGGAKTGAAIGSAIAPGIGTLVGGLAGGALGAVPGLKKAFGKRGSEDKSYWTWRWY